MNGKSDKYLIWCGFLWLQWYEFFALQSKQVETFVVKWGCLTVDLKDGKHVTCRFFDRIIPRRINRKYIYKFFSREPSSFFLFIQTQCKFTLKFQIYSQIFTIKLFKKCSFFRLFLSICMLVQSFIYCKSFNACNVPFSLENCFIFYLQHKTIKLK